MQTRALLAGSLLAIGVLVSALGAGELAVRVLHPRQLDDDLGVILVSPAMRADGLGAVRFLPRTVVRYALDTTQGLEYDVRFRTNNLGYVDEADYPLPAAAGRRTVVIVGDSYSVGAEGGEPWVARLRGASGAALYGLGAPAGGVMHFERALASFRPVAAIPEIVIVATSDDFYRPLWRPLAREDGVHLCLAQDADSTCERHPPAFHRAEVDDSPARLRERAAAVRARYASRPSALRDLLRRSALLRFLARLPPAGNVLARLRSYQPNVEALRRIRRDFPDTPIRLVLVPDKYESAEGRYTVELGDLLEELRIDELRVLDRCPLAPGLYFARDNHPNAAGYRHLARCVGDFLRLGAG